jgi:4-hydroxy-3-methylbut-2-en-1-yl diphosphate synthase IspG/GcpE
MIIICDCGARLYDQKTALPEATPTDDSNIVEITECIGLLVDSDRSKAKMTLFKLACPHCGRNHIEVRG